MTMMRVNVSWQNWPGAPGLSVFYLNASTGSQTDIDAIRAFFAAFSSLIPSGLTINVPSSGDLVAETGGHLNGTWSVGTTPATVTGSGAGNYAGNAGAVVHWLSDGIVNGRRVRGRTFLVPLVSTAYDTAGSLSTTALSTLTTAAGALVTSSAGDLMVWARPFVATAQNPVARTGSMHVVTSSRVPDLAVSLRSRRI